MARSLAFGLVVLERAAGLEEQNESLRARLRAVEARVELSAATPSATPTATRADTPSPTPPSPTAATAAVTGTSETTWVFSSARKPWPETCAPATARYLVRVADASGATVATAAPLDSVLTRHVIDRGTLPAPLSSAYRFEAVTTGVRVTVLDSESLTPQQLADGAAPALRVSLCPACEVTG